MFRSKTYAINQPAMTKAQWEKYCDEKGHPPTWQPHEALNFKQEKE